jgi:Family of unknown function (DUF6346)
VIDQPEHADPSGLAKPREGSVRRPVGPIRFRLITFAQTAGLILLGGVLSVVFHTLVAFYPGTGAGGATGAGERPVQVEVESCEWSGPLHGSRLGFWSTCQVRMPDGRGATVGRSILTEDDVGATVTLAEACSDEGKCFLGRPASFGWQFYVAALSLIRAVGIFVLACFILFFAVATVAGPARMEAFAERLRKGRVRGR